MGRQPEEAWPDRPLLVQPLNPAQNSSLPPRFLCRLGLHLILRVFPPAFLTLTHLLICLFLPPSLCLHYCLCVTRCISLKSCFSHSICFTLAFSGFLQSLSVETTRGPIPHSLILQREAGGQVRGQDLRTRPGPNPLQLRRPERHRKPQPQLGAR